MDTLRDIKDTDELPMAAQQAGDTRMLAQLDVVLFDVSISMTEPAFTGSAMQRLDTAKQYFTAFVDRCQAYGYAHAVGLVTIGADAKVKSELSTVWEKFDQQMVNAQANEGTHPG